MFIHDIERIASISELWDSKRMKPFPLPAHLAQLEYTSEDGFTANPLKILSLNENIELFKRRCVNFNWID